MYNTEKYEDIEIMYQITGGTEKVRCDEFLKIYQTPAQLQLKLITQSQFLVKAGQHSQQRDLCPA